MDIFNDLEKKCARQIIDWVGKPEIMVSLIKMDIFMLNEYFFFIEWIIISDILLFASIEISFWGLYIDLKKFQCEAEPKKQIFCYVRHNFLI